MNNKTLHQYLLLLPLLGFSLFVVLYVVAAAFYPGGSNADAHQQGFSVLHNFWCDLTAEIAKNGMINKGYPYAITALIILCVSMVGWLFLIRRLSRRKSGTGKIVYAAALTAVASLLFFPSGYHEEATNVGAFSGLLAFSAGFVGLYKAGHKKIVFSGLVCMVLLSLNYLVYESGFYLDILPVLQKITFFILLVWLSYVNIVIYKKSVITSRQSITAE